jgi:DNA processing protein
MITKKIAGELAQSGCVIVSGLAKGIDAEAHESAIRTGGKTVAFLGNGVNIQYPYENRRLYEKVMKNGCIISEFPSDMMPAPGLFISRNRLIASLSKAVLIIEGKKDSGALVTARESLNRGKEVFIPMLPLNSRLSEAPLILKEEGARVVTSAKDVIKELKLTYKVIEEKSEKLVEEEKSICEELQIEPFMADELSRKLEWNITKVLVFLTALEMKGVVNKNEEGKYQLLLR